MRIASGQPLPPPSPARATAAASSAAATLNFGPLPDLGGSSLTTPVRHGPFPLIPEDWTGAVEEPDPLHFPPDYNPSPTYPLYMSDPAPAVASALP